MCRLQPHPDVVFQELEGETVLVHLGTNQIYSLNETATRLWQLLVEGCDEAELRSRLMDEFDVDAERLDGEVGSLLDELSAAGLLRADAP